MKLTPRLNPAAKTSVMIKPAERVLEIERGLYDFEFRIRLSFETPGRFVEVISKAGFKFKIAAGLIFGARDVLDV